MKEHQELILDGTKINWHLDRVSKWENGERIAPITIDMALTRACNYSCGFCYAMFQENDRKIIGKWSEARIRLHIEKILEIELHIRNFNGKIHSKRVQIQDINT